MNDLYPISDTLCTEFSHQTLFVIEDAAAQVGEPVSYEIYEVRGDSKTKLEKGEYSIEENGLSVDYDNETVTFISEGINNIRITTSNGTSDSTVIVNDRSSEVYVKGNTQFSSDFTSDNALATYLADGGSISENPFNDESTFALNEKYRLTASIIGEKNHRYTVRCTRQCHRQYLYHSYRM